jgi:hypothetical protein
MDGPVAAGFAAKRVLFPLKRHSRALIVSPGSQPASDDNARDQRQGKTAGKCATK